MSEDSIVTIHGGKWQRAHIEEAVVSCRGRVWRRERWVRRDALVEHGDKSRRLFIGQKYNTEHFDLVRGGWSHDHCEICWWDLFETTDEDHSIGYTDGRDWICAECYSQFINAD
jgi:hypothetical protein